MADIWFKLYSSDYLLDERLDAIPREAEGLLVRMWCVCNRDGFCPADVEELARKTLCRTGYVEKHLANCLAFFVEREGKFFSRRMENEKKRSDQARTNARSRFAKIDESAKSKSRSKSKSESESQSQTAAELNAQPLVERAPEQIAKQPAQESAEQTAEQTPELHPLQYAAKILEDIEMPKTKSNLIMVASAIEAEIQAGKSPPAAFEFVLAGTLDGREQGLETNGFFFQDGKYRVENRMHKARNSKPTGGAVHDTRADLSKYTNS